MTTAAPVFDALETTSSAVMAIADTADWSTPTPAPGWTIAHQIGHLTWTDEVSLTAATDPAGFAEVLHRAMADPLGFVDAGAGELASDPDLRARWNRGRDALVAALRRADPATQLPWFGPPMRPATMATARLMETWAHGLDIADATGADFDVPGALPHVAKLAYKTRDFAYSVHDQQPPADPFDLVLTAPDGSVHRFGPGDAPQRVTGSLEHLCRLAVQRVHRDDTDLAATGTDAAHWLTIAQCFAGAPGPGRDRRGVQS
ncbi:TIGR03084 family metal-binding protein [Tsukamurella serpentis]